MLRKTAQLFVSFALLAAVILYAQHAQRAQAQKKPVAPTMTNGQKIALAESAGPAEIAKKATIIDMTDLPTSQTIFYSQGRGSERFEDAHLFDVALTYAVPVYKRLKPWVKLEARNVFNSTPLISTNITTRPDPNSPKDALGIPTGFIKGSSFGKGTATTNYPFPREFFVSTGIRF